MADVRRQWALLQRDDSPARARPIQDDPTGAGLRSGESTLLATEQLVGHPCLVLLGEAGMGKSHELRRLAEAEGPLRGASQMGSVLQLGGVRTAADLRAAVLGSGWVDAAARTGSSLWLYLDALDEGVVAFPAVVEALINLLPELPSDRLRLRLTCRTGARSLRLEGALRQHFSPERAGQDALCILHLQPLDEPASHALGLEFLQARSDGDAERHMAALLGRAAAGDLGALVARPVTLKLLTSITAKDGLPAQRDEVYEMGTRALLSEWEPEAVERGLRVEPGAAIAEAIAEWSAAAVVFGGVDSWHRDAQPSGVGLGDLARVAGADVTVVARVLRSALFIPTGDGGHVFAHRSFAEFYAARWLRLRVPIAVWPAFLNGAGRVAPQMEEVAAWLAEAVSEWRRSLLERQPDVLLRADPGAMNVQERRELLEALLERCREGELQDSSTGWDEHLSRLDYPGIELDLERWIRAAGVQPVPHLYQARRVAIRRAESALEDADRHPARRPRALRLAEALADVAIAADTITASTNVRSAAAHALTALVREARQRSQAPSDSSEQQVDSTSDWLHPVIRRLRDVLALAGDTPSSATSAQLSSERAPDDEDHDDEPSDPGRVDRDMMEDVRGIALDALFPEHLSVAELLLALNHLPRSGYLGSYWLFLHHRVPKHASGNRELMVGFLGRLAGWAPSLRHHSSVGGPEFVKAAVVAIGPLIEVPEVIEAFSRLLWHFSNVHESVPRPVELTTDSRRRLVAAVLACDRTKRRVLKPREPRDPPVPAAIQEIRDVFTIYLQSAAPWLWEEDDLSHYLNACLSAANLRELAELDAMVWRLFDVDNDDHVALARAAVAKASGDAGELLRWRFAHLADDASIAEVRTQREESRRSARRSGPRDRRTPQERLDACLAKASGRPTTGWPIVLRALPLTPEDDSWPDPYGGDPARFAAWLECSEEKKAQVRATALAFLESVDPEDATWVGAKTFSSRLLDAVRAFQVLVPADAPQRADGLPTALWDRWALTLLDKSGMVQPWEHALALRRRAAREAPEAINRFASMLKSPDLLARDSDTQALAERLVELTHPVADDALLECLAMSSLPPRADAHVMERLVARGGTSEHATQIARTRLAAGRVAGEDQWRVAGRCLLGLPSAADDWELLKPWLEDPTNLETLLSLDRYAAGTGAAWASLPAASLKWVYRLARERFPPELDPSPPRGRAYSVTGRMAVVEARHGLLAVLRDRAEPEDVAALEELSEQEVRLAPLVASARRNAARKAWQPVTWQQLASAGTEGGATLPATPPGSPASVEPAPDPQDSPMKAAPAPVDLIHLHRKGLAADVRSFHQQLPDSYSWRATFVEVEDAGVLWSTLDSLGGAGPAIALLHADLTTTEVLACRDGRVGDQLRRWTARKHATVLVRRLGPGWFGAAKLVGFATIEQTVARPASAVDASDETGLSMLRSDLLPPEPLEIAHMEVGTSLDTVFETKRTPSLTVAATALEAALRRELRTASVVAVPGPARAGKTTAVERAFASAESGPRSSLTVWAAGTSRHDVEIKAWLAAGIENGPARVFLDEVHLVPADDTKSLLRQAKYWNGRPVGQVGTPRIVLAGIPRATQELFDQHGDLTDRIPTCLPAPVAARTLAGDIFQRGAALANVAFSHNNALALACRGWPAIAQRVARECLLTAVSTVPAERVPIGRQPWDAYSSIAHQRRADAARRVRAVLADLRAAHLVSTDGVALMLAMFWWAGARDCATVRIQELPSKWSTLAMAWGASRAAARALQVRGVDRGGPPDWTRSVWFSDAELSIDDVELSAMLPFLDWTRLAAEVGVGMAFSTEEPEFMSELVAAAEEDTGAVNGATNPIPAPTRVGGPPVPSSPSTALQTSTSPPSTAGATATAQPAEVSKPGWFRTPEERAATITGVLGVLGVVLAAVLACAAGRWLGPPAVPEPPTPTPGAQTAAPASPLALPPPSPARDEPDFVEPPTPLTEVIPVSTPISSPAAGPPSVPPTRSGFKADESRAE